MTQPLALSSSTQNSEKQKQAGFKSPPPELSFQFTYSSMGYPHDEKCLKSITSHKTQNIGKYHLYGHGPPMTMRFPITTSYMYLLCCNKAPLP